MSARSGRTEREDVVSLQLARARTGDERAFEALVAPYRRELEVHCYRILGSLTESEDALQESLTAAWLGLHGVRGGASIRTWLYRVTTRRCLNFLRSARRRQARSPAALGLEPPEPSRLGEIFWLEPYPDARLEVVADPAAGPEERYETREAISLAFVTALQLLSARQRAALVLRDVLGFTAREVAAMLQTTDHSINSAVRRARATLAETVPQQGESSAIPGTAEERAVLDRLVRAWEQADVASLVALMTDDVWIRMPPTPLEYQGRQQAARWFETAVFRPGRRFRLVPTRANGQPAFGLYLDQGSPSGVAQAWGLIVASLSRRGITALTHFDKELMGRFGLSAAVSGDDPDRSHRLGDEPYG